ncbi:MAG TPA: sialidase family protein [Candidatus Acidoferrales bacterium]|nr:sialidase family protein [Candidatus Acidoferrales bacterium]
MHSLTMKSVLLLLIFAGWAYAQPKGELIFEPGSVPFESSHASTIVQVKNGDLLAAWFGGTAEGKPDVAIWSARMSSGLWSAPVELAREEGVPCWNPVLFHDAVGRLWLYYKSGPSPQQWAASRKYSDDEGHTWSAAQRLPAGLLGPIRAKPLVMTNGTIVAGSSVEAYRTWAAWIERSTDDGTTWTKLGPFVPGVNVSTASSAAPPAAADSIPAADTNANYGIIQPSVVALGPRHLRFYARSTTNIGRVVVSDSHDNGFTWTGPRPLDVPNPNSGIDVVVLRDGRIVLVYNNTTTGRSPLNLAVSTDGEHFRMFFTLEDQPGEYSYPAIIQAQNGDLEITYTWQRKSIRHVHFPLSDVPK